MRQCRVHGSGHRLESVDGFPDFGESLSVVELGKLMRGVHVCVALVLDEHGDEQRHVVVLTPQIEGSE